MRCRSYGVLSIWLVCLWARWNLVYYEGYEGYQHIRLLHNYSILKWKAQRLHMKCLHEQELFKQTSKSVTAETQLDWGMASDITSILVRMVMIQHIIVRKSCSNILLCQSVAQLEPGASQRILLIPVEHRKKEYTPDAVRVWYMCV